MEIATTTDDDKMWRNRILFCGELVFCCCGNDCGGIFGGTEKKLYCAQRNQFTCQIRTSRKRRRKTLVQLRGQNSFPISFRSTVSLLPTTHTDCHWQTVGGGVVVIENTPRTVLLNVIQFRLDYNILIKCLLPLSLPPNWKRTKTNIETTHTFTRTLFAHQEL